MQNPLKPVPPDSPAGQHGSQPSHVLKRLVHRYPYVSTLVIFAYFLLLFFLIRPIFGALINSLHLPFLPHTLAGEVLLALIVAIPLFVLGWWSEAGFTRGIHGDGVVVCLMPIVLVVLPVFLGFPALIGQVSLTMVILTVILVLLIGFVEEGLCRGLLLRSLLPKGIWTSVLLSSVLFAGIHLANLLSGFSWSYVAGQLLLAFGSGVLFAAVRLRTRSIWPSLLLHAAHDFPGLLLLAVEPQLALTVPLNLSLIVNGTFCAFFLLNAIVLLRPKQVRILRIIYGLVPMPVMQPAGVSYQLPAYPGYMGQPPTPSYPPSPSEYEQSPSAWPQSSPSDEDQPPTQP